MVKVPLRAAPVFADACQLTVPLPLPLLPEVIVSQLVALLDAVQAQPAVVVTVTLLLPPAGTAVPDVEPDVEDKVEVQTTTAGCVTSFPVPPTVIVPLRLAPLFAV